jgi:hypothetical protein
MRKQLLSYLLALSALFVSENAMAQCSATLWSSSTSICTYDSVIFQVQPLGQQSYEWFINGVSQGIGGSSNWDMPTTAGTYIYHCVVTDNNSCVATTNAITVAVSTAPAVNATNNGPLCAGSTLNLSTTTGTGYSYSWTGPGGFTSTLQNPGITNVQPVNAGTYTVAVNAGGCTAYDQTVVVVNSNNPTVTLSSSGTNTCSGDSFYVYSNVQGLTGTTYSWTGPNGFTSNASWFDIQNSTPLNSGVYTVTVTGNGCSGPVTLTQSITMTVTNTPTVTATSNGPICAGSTLNLTGTVSSGTYNWAGPGSFTSTSLTPSITNAQVNNSGVYTLYANDNGCTASAAVSVQVMNGNTMVAINADTTLCVGEDLNLYAFTYSITSATYAWNGPNGFTSTAQNPTINNVTSANAGTYTLTVTGTSCSGPVTMSATQNIYVSACDSVWPGDANSNFVASNTDVLTIGLLYGETGPARTGATTNWVAQACGNWNTVLNGINAKHADCDGDGTVDSADTWVVSLNYGLTHLKEGEEQAKNTAFPDLYFDMTGIVFAAGQQVTIPIKLGTNTTNMQNIYGVAAEVKISGITPTSGLNVTANTSWIGNTSNVIHFTKMVSNDQTDWTLVRKNHTNVTGDGTIGALTFTVPAGTEYQTVNLELDNVTIVNKDGDIITDYNVIDAGGLVFPLSVNNSAAIVNSAMIVPNPSEAQATLQLSLTQATNVNVVVTDVTGRNVWSNKTAAAAGTQTISLPASELAPGMYNIQVRTDKGEVAQSLKWIKK